MAHQFDMLEKRLQRHSNPQPKITVRRKRRLESGEELKEGDDGYEEIVVDGEMEIGDLEPADAPKLSINSINSLFMWHPSGQLIQCGQRAYIRTNPVLYMLAFFGIIGNKAEHNTLAI